jgi:hypothetical protein
MYVAGFLEINFLSPSKGQTPKLFFQLAEYSEENATFTLPLAGCKYDRKKSLQVIKKLLRYRMFNFSTFFVHRLSHIAY